MVKEHDTAPFVRHWRTAKWRTRVELRRPRWKIGLGLLLALVLTVVVLTRRKRTTASQICLVGNAEKLEQVIAVYESWGKEFPAHYYLWGEQPQHDVQNPYLGQVTTSREQEGKLSFKDGIYISTKRARKQHQCEYIFTHDDDLKFYLTRAFTNIEDRPTDGLDLRGRKLASVLRDVISDYRPAIASFPWDAGDNRFEGMREMKDVWEEEAVAPLTGFDNGMVLYHHSVLDFFMPFPPSGEGGFVGNWTLGAHFLQLFGPLVFGEYAIRINSISYNNTINLDNVQESSSITKASTSRTRHPYEIHLNDAYSAFLDSGLQDRNQRYGRNMRSDDVLYPNAFRGDSFSPAWIADRVSVFYNIRHEALSNNVMLQRMSSQDLDARSIVDITFRLIFFTCSRLESFKRTWASFRRALPTTSTVLVEVRVDLCEGTTTESQHEYDLFLDSLSHPFAPVKVIRASSWQGLKKSILSSWNPSSNYEYAIFIEDDVELSPFFLQYAESMVKAYVQRDHADYHLHGFSLYNPRYSEVLQDFVELPVRQHPIILQQPQSWGAVYLPEPWRQFLLFERRLAAAHLDPVIPESYTNRWPHQRSWKKTFLRFMIETQGYFIYPNLAGGYSYATNHVEPGTNDRSIDLKDLQSLQAKFSVPLLLDLNQLEAVDERLRTPPLSHLQILDYKHQMSQSLDLLPGGKVFAQSFDKFTLIIDGRAMSQPYHSILLHYHQLKSLDSIVVLHSDEEVPLIPTRRQLDLLSTSVEFIPVPDQSVHWQYYPWKQIRTDCVMHVSEEWNLPLDFVEYGFKLWQGHHFNNIVGYSNSVASHVPFEIGSKLRTLFAPLVSQEKDLQWASLLAGPTVIHHRRYLQEYTAFIHSDEVRLLQQDDLVGNAPFLVLTFLASKATGKGPVIVNTGSDQGSRIDSKDIQLYSNVLDKLVKLFPDGPLRYTTVFFWPQLVATPPGLHHHRSQEYLPMPYPCSLRAFEESGCCYLRQQYI